ncbi:MAG: stalk domain-containing protein [Caldiserica bacterium]|nr:stalk domain-containing protein [Caldisericota bacterium]
MKQTHLSKRTTILALIVAVVASMAPVAVAAGSTNPPDTYIRARLKDAALRYNVPSAILMAIAYQESGWRQFDAVGNTVVGTNATSQDVGIMQINTSARSDVDRLMTDIDYNIETGARILDGKWKLAPGIGDRDRNVLENWYYAIWAYNGLSSTNNPNTVGGRHYQEHILALMARQVLGSDGQPLWPPVAVTLPNPAIITDPPAWIPTPQPIHYGDLYGGFNQGDNFRVLESPAGAVLSTSAQAIVRFLVQNVGTTTWDATYQPVLAVGDPLIASLEGQALTQSVLPGGTVALTFMLPPSLPAGVLNISLAMRKNSSPFGAAWLSQVTVADIVASATVPDSVTLGAVLDVSTQVSSPESMVVTPGFELRDMQGTLVDSSALVARRYGTPVGIVSMTTPIEQTGGLRYFVGGTAAGLLQPGQYQLTVSFAAGASADAGVSGTVPFATTTSLLTVLPPEQPGLLIVDSVPLGAVVSVDGVTQPALTTPCALPTLPGPHVVQITEANSSPFEAVVDTSAAPATLVVPTLTPVAAIPVALSPSPVNLDFGVLKAGAGVTGQLVVQMNGLAPVQGVVATSANWIRVSPLTFDGSQAFTVGVDARWVDPNANNTGTITFTMGSTAVSVPVKAGFAPTPTVGFILSPQSLRVGEGDEFALDLKARNLQMLFDHVDLTVAWDPTLVALQGVAGSASLTTPPGPSTDPGILQIQSDVVGLSGGETILGSLRFIAVAPTDKTGINLRGTVTLGGLPVRTTTGGCAVSISPRFVLPGTPGGLAAVGEQGQVRVSWQASTQGSYPVVRYDIYRRQGASDLETAELVGEAVSSATQFVDRGPLERASYYYWVMCEDVMGNVSNPAGPVKAQPIIITDPITKVTLVFTIDKSTVVMNGVTVPMETAPVIENGRTILPVRYIATPLGAQVLWNAKEQKVTLIGSKKVELWIGKPTARVDDTDVLIDPANPKVAPRIVGGRTMLPLRFISETFGAEIVYDALLRTVTVTLIKTT